MRKIDVPMLLLAILVIAMFVGVGAAIAMRNVWLVLLFFVLGFGFMSFGIYQKTSRRG